LVNNAQEMEKIWYSQDSFERKCILSARIPDSADDIKRIEKHLLAFKKIVSDAKKLYQELPRHTTTAGGYYKEHPLVIKGSDGTGEPIFDNYQGVIFNGDDLASMAHETFCLRPFEFEGTNKFCKTARKPYDLLVKAVLISAKRHLGKDIEIDSDGDLEDWKEAIQFYQNILKRKISKNWFKEITKSENYKLA